MQSVEIKRFWEIDLLRGIAIIMMVIFHIIFDLAFFEVYDLDFRSGPLFVFNMSIPLLFILLVGISLTLKYNNFMIVQKQQPGEFLRSFVQRGLLILSGGILITTATSIMLNDGVIHFGILHLIGLSIILSIPLLKLKWFNVILGVICVIAGIYIETIRINSPYLLWLGFKPSFYYSLDYFPLLPWFGIVLIGIFLGNYFYSGYKRRYKLMDVEKNILIKKINFMGKHSLIIYFIHQPIIIISMIATGMIEFEMVINSIF